MQTIELSDTEAADFLAWRKHQLAFKVMLASGILDIREGSAELHFDGEGNVGSIKVHGTVYRRNTPGGIMIINVSENAVGVGSDNGGIA